MNEDKVQLAIPANLADPLPSEIRAVANDSPYKKKPVPLNGKLILSMDPAAIGFPNFQSLINMRYTDNHPKGVGGQTPVNPTPLPYPLAKAAIQFNKLETQENHLIVQAWSNGGSGVIDHTEAVPATGDFGAKLLWPDSPGSARGYFSQAPDETVAYCNGVDTVLWGGDESRCAGFTNFDPYGSFNKDYTLQVTNDINDANNRATLTRALTGSGSYETSVYVKSTRALDGVKFYLDTVNTSPNTTIVIYEWIGTGWSQVSNIVNNTSVIGSGSVLGKTGLISFDSTVGSSVVRELDGNVSYVYKFVFGAMDDGVTVYKCTISAPFQSITDIWDGIDRQVLAFYKMQQATKQYMDYTLNVDKVSYSNNDSATYCSLGGLTPAQSLVAGFGERVMGIVFSFIEETANKVNNTVATVEYSYDGVNWTSVGDILDHTVCDTSSFGQSGAIVWNPPSIVAEFESVVSRMTSLYHYRISFNKTLSSGIKLYYVAGIPVPTIFAPYKFPVAAQDRLFLCGYKNKIRYSAVETNCVFNGDDSGEITFEDADEIVGGCSLYSLLGSTLYNLMVFFSKSAMFVLSGTIPNTDKHEANLEVGLAAPATLATVSLPEGVAQGLNRNVAIWQGANGVYVTDGRSPILIDRDIMCFFDKNDSRCINATYVGESFGFIDIERMEYHWVFYSGVDGIRTEMSFDLKRWKWFEIDRTVTKRIGYGLQVLDGNKNSYCYGFTDDGIMHRLEYGTTFDGQPIAYEMRLGDFPMVDGDYSIECNVVKISCICVALTVSDEELTYTHSLDTATVGTSISMGSLKASGKRIRNRVRSLNTPPAVLHSGTLAITTDDETCGLEPILLEYYYQAEREHIKEI